MRPLVSISGTGALKGERCNANVGSLLYTFLGWVLKMKGCDMKKIIGRVKVNTKINVSL